MIMQDIISSSGSTVVKNSVSLALADCERLSKGNAARTSRSLCVSNIDEVAKYITATYRPAYIKTKGVGLSLLKNSKKPVSTGNTGSASQKQAARVRNIASLEPPRTAFMHEHISVQVGSKAKITSSSANLSPKTKTANNAGSIVAATSNAPSLRYRLFTPG